MKYIEVEQKYALPDAAALRAILTDKGAKPGITTRQIDSYYNAPHRDFLAPPAISEWLRIREQDNGDPSLNFKRWLPIDAPTKTHCDEYETTVNDAEAVRRTLAALDFTPMVTVDKTREEWHIDTDTPVIIAIDTIDGLGTFAEFEFKGDADNPEDAINQLTAFIAELGAPLSDRIHRGYPHMILRRDR